MAASGGSKVIPFCFLFAILGLSLSSMAQERAIKTIKADSIDFMEQSAEEQENKDELDSEQIYVDRHPNDTEVGTFQIRSSNDNFLLRIGGFAKLTAYYDAGLENELFFDLYKIAPYADKPKGRFNLQAYESRLNMEVFGKTSVGLFRIFIEGDFLKDNNGGFRLRHAVGQFKGFTFGQTWTYFMDLAATPSSIDFYGTNAIPFTRKPLVGYKYVKEENYEVAASVENPNGNVFRTQDTVRHQLYPDVVGKFTKYLGPHHVQVAGIFRTFIYDNILTGKEEITKGFGAYVSGKAMILENLAIHGQIVYGKGIADYIAMDYVLVETTNGEFTPIRTFSSLLGIKYNINFRSDVNVFASYVNLLDDNGLENSVFSNGFQLNANYLYNILPSLRTGVEVIFGENENKGNQSGNAMRLYVMFQFSF